ncbi:MAG TPA: TolC family protein [Acidobacteriaceae bacterium]|jgi:outer membrane protein TolC
MAVILFEKSLRVKPVAALSLALVAVPLLHAQEVQESSLPTAPSSVLRRETKALGVPAGSGFQFKAAATEPGPQGTVIELPQNGPLRLSLDDAIALGLDRNVRLVYDRANSKVVKGYELQIANALLPSLKVSAQTNTQEINLAAQGFKPQSLAAFGFPPGTVHTIVKVNTTQAMISANQVLFDLPSYELYKGARREFAVVDLNTLNSRGELVLAVGTAYLKVLADQTSLTNAQAEERAAQVLYSQADDKLKAGVGTNLDALRAKVEYQQRQQATVSTANQLAKDTIQLNRIMGLPANQALELTDVAPFAEFADMDLDRAKTTAYAHRKDLLSLQAQIEVTDRELRAAKYQRLPTLAFNGFYGVLGETTGLYHGVFNAQGSLKFPIFREAAQRGEEQQVSGQLTALRQREADLRVAVESQIRTAMLDVNAAHDLVKVAQSNVDLAQQELNDERDRFTAGVDTNLAVVDAQASVTGANAQLVQSLYQYNVAKLQLAQRTGVVESSYRTYLGTK